MFKLLEFNLDIANNKHGERIEKNNNHLRRAIETEQ